MQKLTPTQLGTMFLIPGLLVSIPALLTGNFQGFAMGFGFYATVFGGLMCLIGIGYKPEKR